MDVRAACLGERARSWGSRSSPEVLLLFAVSVPTFWSSGKTPRSDGRACGVLLVVWYLDVCEGGVRGGEVSDGASYTGPLPLRFMMNDDDDDYYYFSDSPSQAVDNGSMATRIGVLSTPDRTRDVVRLLPSGINYLSQLAECEVFCMERKGAKTGLDAGESLLDLEWHGGIESDRREGGSWRKEVSQ